MPFKTQEELESMKKSDPKMAQMYIARAKRQGKPVVSQDNPGYREAIKRRLNRSSTGDASSDITEKRKNMGY